MSTFGSPSRPTIAIERFIKHSLDKLVAAIALLLLTPAFIGLGVAIAWKMGRPIVFSQPRGGKGNTVFTFYKFRTMTDERDRDGNLLPDMQRLTSLGRFLRQTSLDELPQLWNVLIGDMSFVGPRPLIAVYLDRYTPEQARRHNVNPGITGWAQINGRNSISWEEKFALDLWYIDNWSLWLDCQILWQTFAAIVSKKDVDESETETMKEFMGVASSDKGSV